MTLKFKAQANRRGVPIQVEGEIEMTSMELIQVLKADKEARLAFYKVMNSKKSKKK